MFVELKLVMNNSVVNIFKKAPVIPLQKILW